MDENIDLRCQKQAVEVKVVLAAVSNRALQKMRKEGICFPAFLFSVPFPLL